MSGQKDSKVFGSNKKGIDETINQNNSRIANYEKDKVKKNKELKFSWQGKKPWKKKYKPKRKII